MARIRTIKPEFPQSESMGRVSRDARLLFIMLWTLADDAGRLRGNSRMLASLLFPYDELSAETIDEWMNTLESEGCALRYSVDGTHYVQICNWLDHQKIDKPSKSKIPLPPDNSRTVANTLDDSRGVVTGKDQGEDRGLDHGEDRGPGEGEVVVDIHSPTRLTCTDVRFLFQASFGIQMPAGANNVAVEICERYTAAAIKDAFEIASVQNKPNLAYVRGVLVGVSQPSPKAGLGVMKVVASSDPEYYKS